MGSPIGVHADGSNCYTVNCSLQGHSPMGMSKDAFIDALQNENARDKWNKTQNIFKNVNMKYFAKEVEYSDGRWMWTDEQREQFLKDYTAEMKRMEDERFATNGRTFEKDDIHHYARLVAYEAKRNVSERPEWKKVSEEAYEADKERRNAWFAEEDITKSEEYAQAWDAHMRGITHFAEWKKENLKTDLQYFISQVEEARYRRSTSWKEPAYMPLEFNAKIMDKASRRKRYVELMFDEAYVEALNMKDARDISNGDDIVRSRTVISGYGTSMATTINIVS